MKGNYQELQNLVGKNIIMVLTDTIGDMLATIRNGLLVEKEKAYGMKNKVGDFSFNNNIFHRTIRSGFALANKNILCKKI